MCVPEAACPDVPDTTFVALKVGWGHPLGEPHTGGACSALAAGAGGGGQARPAGPSLKAIQPSPRHLVIARRASCRKFLRRTLFVFLGSVYKVIGRPESSRRTVSEGRFCAAWSRERALWFLGLHTQGPTAGLGQHVASTLGTGWSLGTSPTNSAGAGGVARPHPGSPGAAAVAVWRGPRPGDAAAQPGVQAGPLPARLSSPPDPRRPSGHWVAWKCSVNQTGS